MTHSNIVSNVAVFDADVAAATGTGKEYVLGETNSGLYYSYPSILPNISD
jgi:hypothetical protein